MFNFLNFSQRQKRPSSAAVVDLGTHSVKAAVVDLTTFNPTVVGFGKEVYPENTLLSGLVSSWEDFTQTVAGALRQASLSGGFTPSEIVYSLSGEFIKSLTVELLIHRAQTGPIRGKEKIKLEKEMDRLLRIEVGAEFAKITGGEAGNFRIVEKNLVDVRLPQGASLEGLSSILESEFEAALNVSFVSDQSFKLLKRLTADLKKDWSVSFDQLATLTASFKKKEPHVSAVFLDLGGQVCDLAVVSRGRILGERTLPLGGRDLTGLLAEVPGLSLAEAEDKKLEAYGRFFCQSLEAALADILGGARPTNWPLYYWGGAAFSPWWQRGGEAHLRLYPHSLLAGLVWQKLNLDLPEFISPGNLEKNEDPEPVLAVVSQLAQKYAAD